VNAKRRQQPAGLERLMKSLSNLAKVPGRGEAPVAQTPAQVVHEENKLKLLRYEPPQGVVPSGNPILLVPSLINRHYVLDLMPGKSFVEWLVAQGHDVYCIDWGTPGPEDRYVDFDTVIATYIKRSVRKATRLSGTKPHLLGYCLGGTLTAIYAAAFPKTIQSLVGLAAPIRFSEGGILADWSRAKGFNVRTLVDATGLVPWRLMQSAFHMIKPTLNVQKAVNTLDRAWNDRYLDGFLALETWANDNVSLPGAFYVTYIEELYRKDRLVDGSFVVRGRPARLQAITCPTLTIGFGHDYIVPPGSCEVLDALVGTDDHDLWRIDGSHVGGVTSRHAKKTLWPKMSAWWRERDV